MTGNFSAHVPLDGLVLAVALGWAERKLHQRGDWISWVGPLNLQSG